MKRILRTNALPMSGWIGTKFMSLSWTWPRYNFASRLFKTWSSCWSGGLGKNI